MKQLQNKEITPVCPMMYIPDLGTSGQYNMLYGYAIFVYAQIFIVQNTIYTRGGQWPSGRVLILRGPRF